MDSTEILSDTQGVNFNPYLHTILKTIYDHWIPLIPADARVPELEGGVTTIRLRILKDGTLSYMHRDSTSQDEALDKAAWGAIAGSATYPPLPEAFGGPNLELRIRFAVNMPMAAK